MRARHFRVLLTALSILATFVFTAADALAQYPGLRSERPRTYTTQSRINELLDPQTQVPIVPLGRSPALNGELSFDLYMSAKNPTFDQTDARIVVVRDDKVRDNNGNSDYMVVRRADNSNGLQVALVRGNAYGETYLAAVGYTLELNRSHTFRIRWNIPNKTLAVSVNGAPEDVRTLTVSDFSLTNKPFVVWGGRKGDEITKLKLSDVTPGQAPREVLNMLTPDKRLIEVWARIEEQTRSAAYKLVNNEPVVDLGEKGHPDAIRKLALQLGLAYRLTGNPVFRTAALKYADQVAAVNAAAYGEYLQGGRLGAMGVLYDWFYNELSSDQRNRLHSAISNTFISDGGIGDVVCGTNNHLHMTTGGIVCGTTPDMTGATTPSVANYFVSGHFAGDVSRSLPAVIALADEFPGEFGSLLDLLRTESYWLLQATDRTAAAGGHHMGWVYGAAVIEARVELHALLTSALEPSADTLPLLQVRSWQKNAHLGPIYGLRADGTYPASGDAYGKDYFQDLVALPVLSGWRYGNNPFAKQFYDQQIAGKRFRGYHPLELILSVPNLSVPVANLPLSTKFEPSGYMLARDTWDYQNATLLEFKSSLFKNENHHHLDENAFTLFYKAPLLVDSGSYEVYGDDHWKHYYTRSIAHNTLTVYDPTETYCRVPENCYANDGGQQIWEYNNGIAYPTLNDITTPTGRNYLIGTADDGANSFDRRAEFTYMRGNASRSYKFDKLDSKNGFVRSIVFLQPAFANTDHPVTLVFDRVRSATLDKAGFRKSVLFHMVNEPTDNSGQSSGAGVWNLSGNYFTFSNGGAYAKVQTLLPGDATLKKIGGKGATVDYRFALPDGRGGYTDKFLLNGKWVYTYPDEANDSNNSALVPESKAAWRVEVAVPQRPRLDEQFLHAVTVGANTTELERVQMALVYDDSASVTVALGSGPLVVFNKSITLAKKLILGPLSLQNRKMVVTGLLPNALYQRRLEFLLNGTSRLILENVTTATTSTVRSSAAGVVFF
ncbi:MAG: heparinase II/III family protein [Gammaproteobacteria bacterium]|nr:heparinase II/III family protein [Gammaproteobacteria bacterium]